MKEQLSTFDRNLLESLNTTERKSSTVRTRVLQHCLDAGFIKDEDIAVESNQWKWLSEVIDNNIKSLNLLEQITLASFCSIKDFQSYMDAQVSAVVKDIVKRVMATPKPISNTKDTL
ncbi:TPA: hypothetical protein GRR58_22075 [Vibrio parahaemolyticus]|uniref:hypothetical protein n=1 Tax=Vibrio parahaemolyticus TaxID=670 RepID=UPI001A2C72FF|nr:hypothetical protein [Vibrio parahaemolyticus]EGQ8008890.1 hypothetical protein [Vibrio parahaemolyticus]EHK2868922.1 hypothetical protein [Vibrio parahaemolyticus]EJG0673740.1 hypothetical protein [Vibrio parahaemolyticus]ELA9534657.1 hypothetical protein [Vibrio parahaemolyticus]MCC3817770.1 hypothetical protein [Vibrio parahaemolyticus]